MQRLSRTSQIIAMFARYRRAGIMTGFDLGELQEDDPADADADALAERFVSDLEEWTIRTLARFSVTAERRAGRVGVWVVRPDKPPLPDGSPREDKIAAIGVRIRHWVSFHGLSINVEPDLSHYAGIVPCGIADHGVTSLVDLGLPVTMADLDTALAETFDEVFGEPARPSVAA